MKILLSIIIGCFLCSCMASNYKWIENDSPNQTYKKITMRFTKSGYEDGVCYTKVHARAFEIDGKTGVCGYLDNTSEDSCGRDLYAGIQTDWFNAATFTLDGNEISSASFLQYRNRKKPVPCIQTQTPWRDAFEYSQPKVKGGWITGEL